MNQNEIKRLAIERLSEQGIQVSPNATMRELCAAIGVKAFQGKEERWHIEQWLGLPEPAKGIKATSAHRSGHRPAMAPHSHWRQSDIDAAQPPVSGIHATGNGSELGRGKKRR